MTYLCLGGVVVLWLLLCDIWLAVTVVVLLRLGMNRTDAAGRFSGSSLLAMPDEILEVLYGGHLSRLRDSDSCNGFDVVCEKQEVRSGDDQCW